VVVTEVLTDYDPGVPSSTTSGVDGHRGAEAEVRTTSSCTAIIKELPTGGYACGDSAFTRGVYDVVKCGYAVVAAKTGSGY